MPSATWPRPPEAEAVPRHRFRRSRADEEALAREIAEGSAVAFEALCDLHYRPLLTYCRGMLRSRQDAEDAVQETFLSAYEHFMGGDRPDHLRAWLYAIARNNCLMRVRRRKDRCGAADDLPARDLAQEVQERSDLDQLMADLRALPEQQREALVLFELGDLRQAHIAELLGCDATRVKSLVFQARSALRKMRCASCAVPSLPGVITALKERLLTIAGVSDQAGGAPVASSLLPVGAAVNLAIAGILVAGAGAGDRLVSSSGSAGRDRDGAAAGALRAAAPGSPLVQGQATPGGLARRQARPDPPVPPGISKSPPRESALVVAPAAVVGPTPLEAGDAPAGRESLPADRDRAGRARRQRPEHPARAPRAHGGHKKNMARPSPGSHGPDLHGSAAAERPHAARDARCPGGSRCGATEQQTQDLDRPPSGRGGKPPPGRDDGPPPPALPVIPPVVVLGTL